MLSVEQSSGDLVRLTCPSFSPDQSARGRSLLTGLVVESGDSLTTVSPIVDGFIIPSGVRCLTLAGFTVTKRLQTLLQRNGRQAETPQSHVSWSLATQLKERHCFVRTNVSSEWNASGPRKDSDGTKWVA